MAGVFVCFGYETYRSLRHMGLLLDQPVLSPGLSQSLLDRCLLLYDHLEHSTQEQLPYLLLEAQQLVFGIYDMHRRQSLRPSVRTLLYEARDLLGSGQIPDDSCRGTAEYLGLGYENFRKLFRQEFHMPPHTYLIQKRLNSAKELLLQDSLSIQEIAARTGYPDSFSFSKQFKKYTTLTPASSGPSTRCPGRTGEAPGRLDPSVPYLPSGFQSCTNLSENLMFFSVFLLLLLHPGVL